jgi:hypothetical protein
MMIDGIMVEAQTWLASDRSLESLLRDPLETGFLGERAHARIARNENAVKSLKQTIPRNH